MTGPIDILLVEDDPDEVELALLAFRRAGIAHRVHVEATAEHAIAFLRREVPRQDVTRPDLVFLDLKLPGTSGIEVLRFMRADEALADIPTIVLTGVDDQGAMDEAYALKASCFLKKPVDLSVLLGAIASFEEFFDTLAAAES